MRKCNLDQLFDAIYNSTLPVAQKLLQITSDPNICDCKGNSLIHRACAEANLTKLNDFLVLGCYSDKRDRTGSSPLHVCVGNHFIEGATALVNAGCSLNIRDKDGYTPLIKAVLVGNIPLIKFLAYKKCDFEGLDEQGFNALHYAIQCQNLVLVDLLSAGASPNTKDSWGVHPLAMTSNEAVARTLIASGADVNAQTAARENAEKWTPLGIACRGEHVRLVETLLDAGANANIAQPYEPGGISGDICCTPICMAAFYRNYEMAIALVRANVKLNWSPDAHKGPPNTSFCQHSSPLCDIWKQKGLLKSSTFKLIKLFLLAGCRVDFSLVPPSRAGTVRKILGMVEGTLAPLTLVGLCRNTIRRSLGVGIQRKVHNVGLPPRLVSLVLMQDLLEQ